MRLWSYIWVALAAVAVFVGTIIILPICADFVCESVLGTPCTPGSLPNALVLMFLIVQNGIAAAFAVCVGRALARSWRQDNTDGVSRKWGPKARWIIAAAYGLTAAFGVPAVQSDQTAWAIAEYHRIHATDTVQAAEWLPNVRIRSFLAVPVAPGLVFTYHEYQLAGVYGLGTFELYVWYGVGTKSVGRVPLWIS